MPIPVTCQACAATFQVRDDFAGKRGRCPTCGEVVQVPARNGPPSSPSSRVEERRESRSSNGRSVDDDRRAEDRGSRSNRHREDDRRREDDDFDIDSRSDPRRPRKVSYAWRNAASGATSHTVGCIILAVAMLVFLICEFRAFAPDPQSFRPSPAQLSRLQAMGESLRTNNVGRPFDPGAEIPTGVIAQIFYIFDPLHAIFLLVGSVLALTGACFMVSGHGRFGSCPERGFAGMSRIGSLLGWIGIGSYAVSTLLGLLFLLATSTATFLLAMPFYLFALGSICLLTAQLLQGIALMNLGGRYYSGGVKWFSLGVWIAFALAILLLVIFVLTSISDRKWVATMFKLPSARGALGQLPPGLGAFGPLVSVIQAATTSNGVYIAFLILSIILSVTYIFPLNMAKGLILSGEPPAAPPSRRRPQRDFDEYDDRPRSRDRERDRDDDDFDRPRRRGRDDW